MSRKHRHAADHGPLLDVAAERVAIPAAPTRLQRGRQGGLVAPRSEPSTDGAKQWAGGRRDKRKAT